MCSKCHAALKVLILSRNALCKYLQALGFKLGVFHVELKATSRGPRLIEVNARMGGGGVRCVTCDCDQTVKHNHTRNSEH